MEFVERASLFSFNSPSARANAVRVRQTIDYDMDLVIPDRMLSLENGAVSPWTKPQHSRTAAEFRKPRGKMGICPSANCGRTRRR
jgi:excinuclease ABC subunit A